jgi:amidase
MTTTITRDHVFYTFNPDLTPVATIETKDVVATIFSAKTSDEAYWGATQNMHTFLTNYAGLPSSDASSLMSLVGQLRFCQVVDPAKTVRFEFPKWVLEKYNYRLPE